MRTAVHCFTNFLGEDPAAAPVYLRLRRLAGKA
jgi:hypothetical protein